MKFLQEYNINSHDVDCNRVLSPTGCMRYLQDSANFHMEKTGPSYDELFDRGQAFILSRFRVEFVKPVHSHDLVVVETWAVEDGAGASFKRCYEMKKDGESVAVAKSVWAVLDVNRKRLCRMSEVDVHYETDDDLPMEMARRIKGTETEKVAQYTVSFRDVDMNRHMNNTVYADLLSGYIPDVTEKRITAFDIYYAAEAPLGEKLDIYMGKTEKGYYFKTVRQDGKTNVEAVIECE